jgi:glutamate racemase
MDEKRSGNPVDASGDAVFLRRRPIGVFDSGVGGLTVAREIMKLLPTETVIYLGDTANLPYGDKSEEIVRGYSAANTEFLLSFGVKVLVVACNTASSVALPFLKERFDIPIIGVIEPAAKGAMYATRNRKVGVIGTNRTIQSGIYERTLERLLPDIEVRSRACPLFVPLIEEDFIDHEATRLVAKEYLGEFLESGIDTLILGCTHYPLIMPTLTELLPDVKLVDSGYSTAQDLENVLNTQRLLNDGGESPAHRFFATDITEKLEALASRILEKPVKFEKVCLKDAGKKRNC